jgi:3-oxoacyl-[acyl-carrier-protein] synthase III
MRAGISGIGGALPGHVITNHDLAARLDTSDEWIVRRTGIRTRRQLREGEDVTTLAVAACADALADAGRAAEDVDAIIISTVTPDFITPGLAPLVAAGLGAVHASAVDMNGACAGFLYALDHASALIESGRASLILVCGAEALSRITDHEDRSTAVLFGDGAGAVVVTAGDYDLGLPPFELGADGARADLLYADQHERVLRMRGAEVYRHAVARMVEATAAALRAADLGVEDIDLFVAHQANARIIEAAADRLGLPRNRISLHVQEVANTSSASIPLALHQADRAGALRPGDTIALAAFGAGFVWGAGVASWKEELLTTTVRHMRRPPEHVRAD